MENDYISRAAVESLLKYCVALEERDEKRVSAEDILMDFNRIPAADVRPVKEGYWIENCTDYICSACGGVVSDEIVYMLQSGKLPDYCPNCGAKMGGEQNG